ncbi:MAG: hypothetical protein V2A65_05190 [Candidatus Omnitrophota bacterium]
MKNKKPRLFVNNPNCKPAVLAVGAPFAQGAFSAQAGLSAFHDKDRLPLWFEPRSFWPDGSLRWAWMHMEVPPGESEIFLRECEPFRQNSVSLRHTKKESVLAVGTHRLTVSSDGKIGWQYGKCSWTVNDLGAALGTGEYTIPREVAVQLLEPGNIAPLLKITRTAPGDRRLEYLVRLFPSEGILSVTRRLSSLSPENKILRGMQVVLATNSAGRWEMDSLSPEDNISVLCSSPGTYVFNGTERQGYPQFLLKNAGAGFFLEKAWQRFPAGLQASSGKIVLDLYPFTEQGILLWSGTNLRHRFILALGAQGVDGLQRPFFRWDSEYICSTGAMGLLAPCTEKSRYFFTGYETAVESAFSSLRRSSLGTSRPPLDGPAVPLEQEEKQAPEYFGLQHYGDWPLEWGRYAGPNPHHRIYADNEYDIPFAFFQQFARTGDIRYLEIAREGIVHMADVDMDILHDKMFYHGYFDYGEDHNKHRATPGVGDHSWTEGLWCAYFLCGDIWAREAAEAIGRSLMKGFAGETDDAVMRHWFCCERTVGWPMIQLSVNAESNGDRSVLAKISQMADFLARYFSDPDGMFLQTDSFDGKKFKWFRAGAQDGTKTLMLSIVMEGLERYHRLTGDPKAVEAMEAIAGFLISRMWDPVACMFTYELNAYERKHRSLDPVPGILPVRPLAYLYEMTGKESYRTIAKESFFGAFWILTASGSPPDREGNSSSINSARDLGIIMRSANAALYWFLKWKESEEEDRRSRMVPASSRSWRFAGTPEQLLRDDFFSLENGSPVFVEGGVLSTSPRFNRDGELIQDGKSFLYGRFQKPLSTLCGAVSLKVRNPWEGDTKFAVCQRGWLHLSGEQFTASAVSIISFYGKIQARLYDAERNLVESVEASCGDWQPGEVHTVALRWNEEEAVFVVDGKERDRRSLDRRLGGSFTRCAVGYHPAHWTFEGEIVELNISIGKIDKKLRESA